MSRVYSVVPGTSPRGFETQIASDQLASDQLASDQLAVMRDNLFGRMAPTSEVSVIRHAASQTELRFEIIGTSIKLDGVQHRTGGKSIPIRETMLFSETRLEAVVRYQELLAERLVEGFILVEGGPAAYRVVDRLSEIVEYMNLRSRERRNENDRRASTRPRDISQLRTAVVTVLGNSDAVSNRVASRPVLSQVSQTDANTVRERTPDAPDYLARFGGKRKLLRNE